MEYGATWEIAKGFIENKEYGQGSIAELEIEVRGIGNKWTGVLAKIDIWKLDLVQNGIRGKMRFGKWGTGQKQEYEQGGIADLGME